MQTKKIKHVGASAKAVAPRKLEPRKRADDQKLSISWIRDLAAPYLKGYAPVARKEGGLEGYWFFPESSIDSKQSPSVSYFVGYLVRASRKYSFLNPEPPECVIFAWINPENARLHEHLVHQPGSLVRKTFEYIRWLTHRPPRFVFHESEGAAMARHVSMKSWTPAKYEHFSRNFFIETLAWLVRSGLVRKLREEASVLGRLRTERLQKKPGPRRN